MKYGRKLACALLALVVALNAAGGDGRVTIEALDAEGRPVAGAEVSWLPYSDGLVTTFPGPEERARTDEDGSCTIDYRDHPRFEENNFEVRVTHPDAGVADMRIYPTRQDETATLHLRRQGLRRGTVRDSAGTPVEGVVVGSTWFPLTTTDTEGQFAIMGEGNGSSALSFFKDGYAWVREHTNSDLMEVVLSEGSRVILEAVDEAGEPLPGAMLRYHAGEFVADEAGRVETLPLSAGERFMAQGWRYDEVARYFGEGQWVTVSGAEPQVVQIVLQRRDLNRENIPFIAGRVVRADTGAPVRSRIMISSHLHDFHYMAEWEADTDKEGAFRIENVYKRKQYLQALPIPMTLYPVEGVVEVDCTDGTVDDVVLTVAEGVAIRGRVVTDGDAAERKRRGVSLSHNGRHYQVATSETGRFVFPNLPPEPRIAELRCEQQELRITLPPPGEILSDVFLSIDAPRPMAHLSGTVRDREGNPLPSAWASFLLETASKETVHLSAFTDPDGHFEIETEYAGTVHPGQFQASRQYVIGDISERVNVDGAVISHPEAVYIDPAHPATAYDIVIEIPEADVIGGTITDDAGNPLEAEVDLWMADGSERRAPGRRGNGVFLLYNFNESPEFLKFSRIGHQSRILKAGRDFKLGDRTLKVVLPAGPYDDVTDTVYLASGMDRDVLMAASGRDEATLARVAEEFRERAAEVDDRVPLRERVMPAAGGTTVDILALYPDGTPVTRLLTRAAEPLGHQWPVDGIGVESVDFSRDQATRILEDFEGEYTIPVGTLVWVEGRCRYLVMKPADTSEADGAQFIFYPEHRLTFRVLDAWGTPVPEVYLAPAQIAYRFHGSRGYGLQPSDENGEVVYTGLPPGDYAFKLLTDDDSRPDRYVFGHVATDADTRVEIVAGPYPDGSGRAILEGWLGKARNNPEYIRGVWKELDFDARTKVADAVVARLAEMTSVVSHEYETLAAIAQIAEAHATLEDLMRLYPSGLSRFRHEAAFAIAVLGKDDAIPFLEAAATDVSLEYRQRLYAIAALNRIGSEASVAAWERLYKRASPESCIGAEDIEDADTQEITEALIMTLCYIPENHDCQEPGLGSVEIDHDAGTATMGAGDVMNGYTTYEFRKIRGKWLVVGIGDTIIS